MQMADRRAPATRAVVLRSAAVGESRVLRTRRASGLPQQRGGIGVIGGHVYIGLKTLLLWHRGQNLDAQSDEGRANQAVGCVRGRWHGWACDQ